MEPSPEIPAAPGGVSWTLVVATLILVPELVSLSSQLLQRSRIGSPVPSELQGIYGEGEYATSNRYSKAKSTVGLLKSVFDIGVFFAFWLLRGFPWLDGLCVSLQLSDLWTGVVFMGLFGIMSNILDLPWDVHSTFVLEEMFGFNKTTARTFIKDRLKGLALMVLLGGPVVLLVLWFFTATGPHAWFWVFLALTAIQVVLLFLTPVLLLPLFMEMIPLPTGTAVITGGLEKAPGLKFLSTRVLYARSEDGNEKTCWVTKDRRFDGAKAGAVLSISWSRSEGLWTLADGDPKDWPAGQTPTFYARSAGAGAPVAGEEMDWVLTSHAKSLAKDAADAGNPEEPLLPDSMRSSCVDVGSLRSKLRSLADKLGYKGANIYVIDGSTRSEHSNAFCTGFGRFRRVCLFDTLLPVMNESEIVAVLGHEIGHDRLYHVHTRLVLGILQLFVTLFAMGQCLTSPIISSAFFVPEPKVYLGIVLFGYVWGMIDFAVSIPLNMHSRANEFAADRYSVDADRSYARALGDGLKKLHKKSKANLTPHPFFVFLSYSHPPLDARLQAIMQHHKKKWS